MRFIDLPLERYALREATIADAAAIADVQVRSWRSSYRGMLPASILEGMDPRSRVEARRAALSEPGSLHVVAYDTTAHDVVGFCYAGVARDGRLGRVGDAGRPRGEIYELYLVDRAKRYGLGRELVGQTLVWARGRRLSEIVVWVLEQNAPARRFYEALGGRLTGRTASSVRGFGVREVAYVYSLG